MTKITFSADKNNGGYESFSILLDDGNRKNVIFSDNKNTLKIEPKVYEKLQQNDRFKKLIEVKVIEVVEEKMPEVTKPSTVTKKILDK